MREYTRFFINGEWVQPHSTITHQVINPATEEISGVIMLGDESDVNRAVAAARAAFLGYSLTSRAERLAIFDRLIEILERRAGDMAKAITEEMGAPAWLAEQAHVPLGLGHLNAARDVLREFEFGEQNGTSLIVKEPIGVCAFITPWNWPLNQIVAKVAPALAVGCTMILKPSEIAPYSANLFAEIIEEAGLPPGVFNLIHGDGAGVGTLLSKHPDVDMISFTGSTRAGIEVARNAAPTVKRVHQELGGKSPNIILNDADFSRAVAKGVVAVMRNSGQTCTAPTRMLVPQARVKDAIDIARTTAEQQSVGDPNGNAKLGPVVSRAQWEKIQHLIQTGIDEGATLVTGGLDRPEPLARGYYVKPTVFAHVKNDMTIAREEIFGPVLAILGYEDEAEAIRIANDTPYGLAAYVQGELDHARRVAAQLRAGRVEINHAPADFLAPFGGYKHSGNGREWGEYAFDEFVELKAIIGYALPEAAE